MSNNDVSPHDVALMQAEQAKQRASEVLTYYLKRAWEEAGLGWSSDNAAEAHGIVDNLFDVAAALARAEATKP